MQDEPSYCVNAQFWPDESRADLIGFTLRDASSTLYELAAAVTNIDPPNRSRGVCEMRDDAARFAMRAADEMRVSALVANAASSPLRGEDEAYIADYRDLDKVREVTGEEPVAWLAAQARKCLEEAGM